MHTFPAGNHAGDTTEHVLTSCTWAAKGLSTLCVMPSHSDCFTPQHNGASVNMPAN